MVLFCQNTSPKILIVRPCTLQSSNNDALMHIMVKCTCALWFDSGMDIKPLLLYDENTVKTIIWLLLILMSILPSILAFLLADVPMLIAD